MAKYTVVQAFTDRNTEKVYQVGDKYPANAKRERIEELLGDEHENHKGALIEVVEEEG